MFKIDVERKRKDSRAVVRLTQGWLGVFARRHETIVQRRYKQGTLKWTLHAHWLWKVSTVETFRVAM